MSYTDIRFNEPENTDCNIEFAEFNGVDILTELDIISDQIEVGGVSKTVAVQLLRELIVKLGKCERKRKMWSKSEKKYLIENYKDKTNQELANALNRTFASVSVKSCLLGLHKSKKFISEKNGRNAWGPDHINKQKLKKRRSRAKTVKPAVQYKDGVLRHKIK